MHLIRDFVKRLGSLSEDRKTAASAKHAKTEPPLLRSYVASLLGLVACAAMFLSTTFAWFSSNVSNGGNEIYIGSLHVGLYKQSGDDRLDLADDTHKLFDNQIRWEPGYTVTETIHVVNEGNLTFKYSLGFTDGTLAEDSTLLPDEVARCFEVWVYTHADGAAPAATDYAAISAADSGWVNAGTLDTILAGTAVLSGVMAPPTGEDDTSATYTVALHMLDDADAAVMGQRLSLNVKLIAYQQAAGDITFVTDATPEQDTATTTQTN